MKKITTLFAALCITATTFGETKEPCKGVFVPSNLESSTLIFELPTYNEYVQDIVLQSLAQGITAPEKSILNEEAYRKIRKDKIKTIKNAYSGDYKIMTKKEVIESNTDKGLVFKEQIIMDLVSASSLKFENYTSFKILDLNSGTDYILVDRTSESSNCIVKEGEFKFLDLISMIQK